MIDEIEFRRRFEQFWAEQHDLRPQDVAEYRMTDGSYRLPGIASHWRTYKRACEDSKATHVLQVVELPEWFDPYGGSGEQAYWRIDVDRALDDAGVKYK